MAGTSEATIKRHYREVLTPEVGKAWFKIGANFNGSEVIRDQKRDGPSSCETEPRHWRDIKNQ
jgi:hypothetical protein